MSEKSIGKSLQVPVRACTGTWGKGHSPLRLSYSLIYLSQMLIIDERQIEL